MSYPVVLNVAGRTCLVVGGGPVGMRKARGLRDERANVTVLSSSFSEQLDGVDYITARYTADHLTELRPWLVVTCTDNGDTNAAIQRDADAIGALVIRADDSRAGDAHGIMKRERGDITLAMASGVPTFSRYLLDRFEAQLTPEVVALGAELKIIRAELRERLATPEDRTAAWNAITPRFPIWVATLNAGKPFDLRAEVEAVLGENGLSDG